MEIESLKVAQHPNIVRLIDLFEDDKHFFLILEYMQGGDCFDYLQKRNFVILEERAK